MDRIDKRVALVTGGNRGIGKEIARSLAKLDVRVVIGVRDECKGSDAVHELREEGLLVAARMVDVSDRDSVDRFVRQFKEEYGRLDILVNNAAVQRDRATSVLDLDEDVFKETFETNFYGPLRLIQGFVPLMKERGYGRIVNVSSGLGAFEILQGLGGLKGSSAAYRISKTMLNALTCLVAEDVAGTGIKANAACPGHVRTDMGGADAPSSVGQGADTPVWLAMLDEKGPSGGFFRERRPIPW